MLPHSQPIVPSSRTMIRSNDMRLVVLGGADNTDEVSNQLKGYFENVTICFLVVLWEKLLRTSTGTSYFEPWCPKASSQFLRPWPKTTIIVLPFRLTWEIEISKVSCMINYWWQNCRLMHEQWLSSLELFCSVQSRAYCLHLVAKHGHWGAFSLRCSSEQLSLRIGRTKSLWRTWQNFGGYSDEVILKSFYICGSFFIV